MWRKRGDGGDNDTPNYFATGTSGGRHYVGLVVWSSKIDANTTRFGLKSLPARYPPELCHYIQSVILTVPFAAAFRRVRFLLVQQATAVAKSL